MKTLLGLSTAAVVAAIVGASPASALPVAGVIAAPSHVEQSRVVVVRRVVRPRRVVVVPRHHHHHGRFFR